METNWAVLKPNIWPCRVHLLHNVPNLTLKHCIPLLLVYILLFSYLLCVCPYYQTCQSPPASAYCIPAFNYFLCYYCTSWINRLLPSKCTVSTAFEPHSTIKRQKFAWRCDYRRLLFPVFTRKHSSEIVPFLISIIYSFCAKRCWTSDRLSYLMVYPSDSWRLTIAIKYSRQISINVMTGPWRTLAKVNWSFYWSLSVLSSVKMATTLTIQAEMKLLGKPVNTQSDGDLQDLFEFISKAP